MTNLHITYTNLAQLVVVVVVVVVVGVVGNNLVKNLWYTANIKRSDVNC
jgi:hypothetical protein